MNPIVLTNSEPQDILQIQKEQRAEQKLRYMKEIEIDSPETSLENMSDVKTTQSDQKKHEPSIE